MAGLRVSRSLVSIFLFLFVFLPFYPQCATAVTGTRTPPTASRLREMFVAQFSKDENCELTMEKTVCSPPCNSCTCGKIMLSPGDQQNFLGCSIVLREVETCSYGYIKFKIPTDLQNDTAIFENMDSSRICKFDVGARAVDVFEVDKNVSDVSFGAKLTNVKGKFTNVWYRTNHPDALVMFLKNTTKKNLENPVALLEYQIHRTIPDGKCFPEMQCKSHEIKYKCRCYQLTVDYPISWQLANKTCSRGGKGYLVMLKDAEDIEAITTMLIQNKMWRDKMEHNWIYIGLKRRPGKMYQHQWSDNTTQVISRWYRPIRDRITKTFAYGGKLFEDMFRGIFVKTRLQPTALDSEDCVAMHYSGMHDRVNWIHIPCSFKAKGKVGYICQTKHNTSNGSSKSSMTHEILDRILSTPDSVQTALNTGASMNMCENSLLHENRCYVISRDECPTGFVQTESCGNVPQILSSLNYQALYGDIECKNENHTVPVDYHQHTTEINMIDFTMQNQAVYSANDVETYTINKLQNNKLCEGEPRAIINSCNESDHQFQCKYGNGKLGECILYQYVGDGHSDCRDGMEEGDITPERLESGVPDFQCRNGGNVSWSAFCDFHQDCSDGSDEENCQFQCSPESQYRCTNGQCILDHQQCDGVVHCLDGSDEVGCGLDTASQEMRDLARECYDGMRYHPSRAKDLIPDCMGNGQEDEYVITDDIIVGEVEDIVVKKDRNSTEPRTSYCAETYSMKCHLSGAKCYNLGRTCIYDEAMFDVADSCRDGVHLERCADFKCPGFFKCPNSYCIPTRKLCDQVADCPDGDDESLCWKWKDDGRVDRGWDCPGYYKCRGERICIPQSSICDGKPDCKFWEDEKFCGLSCPEGCSCTEHYITCANVKLTIETFSISSETRALSIRGAVEFNRSVAILRHITNAKFLGYLILRGNGISSIPNFLFSNTQNFQNLRHLDLRENKIEKLTSGSFSSLKYLITLLLSENEIKTIEVDAFPPSPFITELDISGQKIANISAETFANMPALKIINISNNPLLENIAHKAFVGLDELSVVDIEKTPYLTIIEYDDLFGNSNLSEYLTDSFEFCCGIRESPSFDNCTPKPNPFSSCADLMANKTLQILVWVLGTMALIGNIFVIVWRAILQRSDNNVNSFFILNLSLSDLLMGVYLYIIATMDVIFRNSYYHYSEKWRASSLCTLAGVLNLLSSEVSVFMLLLISIDRFIAIVLTFNVGKISMKAAWILSVSGWIFFLLVCLVPVFLKEVGIQSHTQFYTSSGTCMAFSIDHFDDTNPKPIYLLSYLVIGFNFVSFVIIAVLYVFIYLQVRKVTQALKSFGGNTTDDRECSIAQKLIILIATDFFCWMPVIIIKFLGWVSDVQVHPEASAWIAVFVLPLNSAMNPFLFTISVVKIMRKKDKYESKPTSKDDARSYPESRRSIETVT